MSTTTTVSSDFEVNLSTSNSGFRPSLNAYTGGAYAANALHGAAQTLFPTTGNWNTVTLRGNTSSLNPSRALVRKQGKQVDFMVQLTLDATAADPGIPVRGADADELRIAVAPVAANEPGSYNLGLPVAQQFSQPLFDSVEIIDNVTGNTPAALAATVIGSLQARLLVDGTLALVRQDTVTGLVTSPLLNSDIAGIFGGAATITLTVRGSYRAQGPPAIL